MRDEQTKDPFVSAFGPPDEAATPLCFIAPFLEENWQWRYERTGAGWFFGRFFFLLGEGLDRLQPCLDAWSFLLSPQASERKIIGYNAHGALLVLEDEMTEGVVAPVRLLDPLTARWWGDPECVFGTLMNRWLPDRLIPHFLDTTVYEQWLKTSGRFLAPDEILGIHQPLPLGGEMKLENVTPINILEYYRATGPVYAQAHATLKGQP